MKAKLQHAERFGPGGDVWNKPVLFIHIPKAAGSSIARLDVGYTFGHKTFRYYEKWKPEDVSMPATFTITRHPVDRYISAFRYLQEGRGNGVDQVWARKNGLLSSNVDAFAIDGLTRPEVQSWMHFRPQLDYVIDSEGRPAVNHVFRFETLAEEWPVFAERYGLPRSIPQYNAAPTREKAELSPAARERIFQVYADDFEAFGYE